MRIAICQMACYITDKDIQQFDSQIWEYCLIRIQCNGHLNLNLNLKNVYSIEYSFAHCTIAVSKITKSSGDPY